MNDYGKARLKYGEYKYCNRCENDQPIEDFLFANRKKGVLKSYCRSCGKGLYKDWYYRTDQRLSYRKDYYKNNREKCRQSTKSWEQRNRHKGVESTNRRRERTKRATPTWLSQEQKDQVTGLYLLARDCTIVTGESYHVDHIVPLKGKNVCGLHVPWNLQVLPSDVNQRKGSKYEP